MTTLGRCAGKNPVIDPTCFVLLYLPFIIFCEVPVLPATLYPGISALLAVPPSPTTSQSMSPSNRAVFVDMTRLSATGGKFIELSASYTLFIICGRMYMPWLAMVLIAQ